VSSRVFRFIVASLAGLALGHTVRAAPFLRPAARERLQVGDVVEVRWAAVRDDAEEMELLLSTDGGRSFPVRVSEEISPDATSVRWRVPGLPTRHARLAIRSGDGEDAESEALRIVSEEFEIAADPRFPDDDEPLFRTDGEWRTTEALVLKDSQAPARMPLAGAPAVVSARDLETAAFSRPTTSLGRGRSVRERRDEPNARSSPSRPLTAPASRSPLPLRL